MLLHATTVSIAGHAVLSLGPSGAGKSQLAMRLIHRGAMLIADDQTVLSAQNGMLWASCPPNIVGKLEVRGVGIVSAAHQAKAPVRLVLNLDPAALTGQPDRRMPEIRRWAPPSSLENTRPIPCVPLDAFRQDAAEAVIAALAHSREWEDSPAL